MLKQQVVIVGDSEDVLLLWEKQKVTIGSRLLFRFSFFFFFLVGEESGFRRHRKSMTNRYRVRRNAPLPAILWQLFRSEREREREYMKKNGFVSDAPNPAPIEGAAPLERVGSRRVSGRGQL